MIHILQVGSLLIVLPSRQLPNLHWFVKNTSTILKY